MRYGGREKGTKNRATLQREAEAAARVAATSGGKAREGALAVMERLMGVAEGATEANRPTLQRQIAVADATGASIDINPDGDWGRFHDFLNLTFSIAKELARYQAPQVKAVDAPAPPPDPDEIARGSRRRFGLRVFEGGKPLSSAERESAA